MFDFELRFVRVFQVSCSCVVILFSLVLHLGQLAYLLYDASVHIEVEAFELASPQFETLEQRPPLERFLSWNFFTV